MMVQGFHDVSGGRARLYLAGLNLAIVKGVAGRRQKDGIGNGARPQASIAARPVTLCVVRGDLGGFNVRETAHGTKTARRALPRMLAVLDDQDPRRRAAEVIALAVERLGALGGTSFDNEGASDTSGGQSDGGATTRIKHAARLRLVEAAVNGWAVDKRTMRITRGPDRVALPVRRKRGAIKQITAMSLILGLCVEGFDMTQILRLHGWSVHTKHSNKLIKAAWAMLDDVADLFGFGRSDDRRAPVSLDA